LDVDTSNLEEFWNGIKEMRKTEGLPQSVVKRNEEKKKDLKKLITYQNFFKNSKTASKESSSRSKIFLVHTKTASTKFTSFN